MISSNFAGNLRALDQISSLLFPCENISSIAVLNLLEFQPNDAWCLQRDNSQPNHLNLLRFTAKFEDIF